MLKHKTTYRVIYGDTDNMGYAYNANYLRWFEMGRGEMFRALGLTYKAIEAEGFFLPVSEVQCKFLSPVRYDDLLIIETTLDTGVKGGMKFDYCIYDEDGVTVRAKGYSKHAFVDRSGRVVRPPGFIADVVNKNSGK